MSQHAATADLSSVDLSDLDLWVDGPPHELFARLRAEAPVHLNATVDGPPFWSLTKAEDVTAVSNDPATFSAARGGIFLRPDTLLPLELGQTWVIFKDPPEHTRHREIVAKAFQARSLVIIDDVINEVIASVLDKVADKGSCDLVADIAVPVPLTVISRLLGSPDEDLPLLRQWVEEIQEGISGNTDGKATLERMAAHFQKVVGNELVRGIDSLAGSVANAELDGERLTDDEIAVYFGVLLFAGVQHTRDAISSSLLALLENPDQLKLLRAEPSRLRCTRSGLSPAALDELVRWSTSVNYMARTATANTSIRGVDIKEGDRVVMWYAAASRDPELFPGAETLDVTRKKHEPPHFAFGGGGPHFCQAASLANRLVSFTLMAVLKRLDNLELSGEPTRARSSYVNSLRSLPVRFGG